MSINIKGASTKPSQARSSKAGSASKGNKGSAARSAPKSTNDSIELTNTASQLQQIEQSLNDIPIIDSNRVDAVSQSIKDGLYQVNNEKIADRIIKNENDLNKLQKP